MSDDLDSDRAAPDLPASPDSDAADAMARALMAEWLRCQVTHDGRHRCEEPPHGVRWEDGFLDLVCERGRANAEKRGVTVYPRSTR
jgi:hypothetical protein